MVPPERPELSASADDAGMRSTATRQAVVRVLRITGGLQREESIDILTIGIRSGCVARPSEWTFNRASPVHPLGTDRGDFGTLAAAEVLWTCSFPELYELLVLRRGWTIERWSGFIANATIAALLAGNG